MRPAVVVDHHELQVHLRLLRPTQQAADVVQERQVPEQRVATRRSGGPSAAPTAVETVPSMPASPRLASTSARSPPSHQVEVAHRVGGADDEDIVGAGDGGDDPGGERRGAGHQVPPRGVVPVEAVERPRRSRHRPRRQRREASATRRARASAPAASPAVEHDSLAFRAASGQARPRARRL